MRHIPGLYIMHTDKGRSMFTAESIKNDDVIESCPVILIPKKQTDKIHTSVLHDYYFVWPSGDLAIALGYGSLYNHSTTPNAEVIFDVAEVEIIIKAKVEIAPGAEILIDYSDGDRNHELWFNEKRPTP